MQFRWVKKSDTILNNFPVGLSHETFWLDSAIVRGSERETVDVSILISTWLTCGCAALPDVNVLFVFLCFWFCLCLNTVYKQQTARSQISSHRVITTHTWFQSLINSGGSCFCINHIQITMNQGVLICFPRNYFLCINQFPENVCIT